MQSAQTNSAQTQASPPTTAPTPMLLGCQMLIMFNASSGPAGSGHSGIQIHLEGSVVEDIELRNYPKTIGKWCFFYGI